MNTTTQQFVTDSKGKKTAVMIPIDQYEELMEDLHDLGKIAERKEEKDIDLEKLTNILNKNESISNKIQKIRR
jgi:PHD/YefM family antitoxin component YafN of YafNO toxin-antitoxin module